MGGCLAWGGCQEQGGPTTPHLLGPCRLFRGPGEGVHEEKGSGGAGTGWPAWGGVLGAWVGQGGTQGVAS